MLREEGGVALTYHSYETKRGVVGEFARLCFIAGVRLSYPFF